MWTAILALLQSVPVVARIVDKLTPTRQERQIDKIRNEKQTERKKIDDWIDRGGDFPFNPSFLWMGLNPHKT